MASLVLGLAGAAVGSMFGAAKMGWMIGSTVGKYLEPKPEGPESHGPRLEDLKVQAATEGSAIPTLYGTMRMAGNIIWSGGLDETKHTQSSGGGGKGGGGGGGSTHTTYTYSASFAVGFCEGPIVGVRRIWADSVLIYDVSEDASTDAVYASGSIKSGMHVVEGTETQQPSSIIEAVEGIGNTPAYRGLCYIVFDDLELEKYGNRIPNITAEIVQKAETTELVKLTETTTLPLYVDEAPKLVSFDNGTVSFRTDPNDPDWQYYNESQLKRYSFDMRGTYLGVENDGLQVDIPPPTVYLGSLDGFDFTRSTWQLIRPITYKGQTYSIYPYEGNTLGITIDPIRECYTIFRVALGDGGPWYYEKYNKNTDLIQTGQIELPSYPSPSPIGDNGCANGMFVLDQSRSGDAWYVDNYRNLTIKYQQNDSDDWEIVSPVFNFTGGNQLGGVADDGYLFLFVRWSMIVITDNSSFSPLSVPLNEIVEDLCDRVGINSADIDVSSLATIEVQGYVRPSPMPSRAAIDPLLHAYQIGAVESDDILKFFPLDGEPDETIVDSALGATNDKTVDKVLLNRVMDMELPRRVKVTYHEVNRDYQKGCQRAQRILT